MRKGIKLVFLTNYVPSIIMVASFIYGLATHFRLVLINPSWTLR